LFFLSNYFFVIFIFCLQLIFAHFNIEPTAAEIMIGRIGRPLILLNFQYNLTPFLNDSESGAISLFLHPRNANERLSDF